MPGSCVFDWRAAKVSLDEWLATNFYDRFREWAYKDIQPRILVKSLLVQEDGSLARDYKFFCSTAYRD